MSTRNPAVQVLAITKLVEAIFINLPIRKIFAAQMVCCTWRDTIKSSPAVQDKLLNSTATKPLREPGRCSTGIHPLVFDTLLAVVARQTPNSAWSNPEASWRKLPIFPPSLRWVYLTVAGIPPSSSKYCRYYESPYRAATLEDITKELRGVLHGTRWPFHDDAKALVSSKQFYEGVIVKLN